MIKLKITKKFENQLKELNMIHKSAKITLIYKNVLDYSSNVIYTIIADTEFVMGSRLPIDFVTANGQRSMEVTHQILDYMPISPSGIWDVEVKQTVELLSKLKEIK